MFLKLIIGNSRDMLEVKTESVDMIVTSPPYISAIDYNRANPDNIGNFTGLVYYDMMYDVYSELFRVLKPGRKFCLNVQDIPSTEETTGLDLVAFRSALLCQKVGWELIADIIWDKGRNRAGGTPLGTIPFPASPVILGNYEHLFVFRKPGKPDYSHVTVEQRESSRLTTPEIAESIYSVWAIKPELSRSGHPAPFPQELPRRLIKFYSFIGETILEPFVGSGTTMKVCKELRRNCIGYELEEKYIEVIKEKVCWNQLLLDGDSYIYEIIRRTII